MSLATRCTTCGTVFRVVQDQLKVSEGWVRCGRCNEVFNALEGLFDLERDTPPPWKPDEPPAPQSLQRTAATAPQNLPPAAAAPVPRTSADFDAMQLDRIDAQLLRGRHADNDSTPAQRVDERDRLEFPDARFDPDAVDVEVDALDADTVDPALAQPMTGPGPGSAPMAIGGGDRLDPLVHVSPSMIGDAADTATELPPDFLRYAKRRQQRAGPLATLLWTVTALLLAAGLALQAAHHFRDGLAARWPAARPALGAACDGLGCTIQPPRHIDEITVESSALARAAAPDAFKLAVGLRNRSTLPLALPAVELSLTDATGQLVARRVLQPADFHAATSAIAAGTDTALQLVFQADTLRFTGYTVEIFYP